MAGPDPVRHRDGAGGAGKSFFAADLAARVSRGDIMPDGTPGSLPAPVIFVGLEDSPEASTVHRLTAARADLANVIDASESPSGAQSDVTVDLPWLREVNDQAGGARLAAGLDSACRYTWRMSGLATIFLSCASQWRKMLAAILVIQGPVSIRR